MEQLGYRTALLVVDMQKGFSHPSWGERTNPDAEWRIAMLLHAWRAARAPVIHVHHLSPSPSGCFRAGTPGSEPLDLTAPLPGEAVLRKRVNSAFIGTSLEADLRRTGIEGLVLVGLTTNHCISTTARMAGNLGFRTCVVSDATATFARTGASGRMRSAEEVHDAALGDLQYEFADVQATQAVVDALARAIPMATPLLRAGKRQPG